MKKKIDSYELLIGKLQQYKDYPVCLSVKRYLPFSILTNFGAKVRGYEPFSHTAYLYYENKVWWVVDSTMFKNYKKTCLWDYSFANKKRGKCILHIIPHKKQQKENFDWDIKYSIKKAILSWFKQDRNKDRQNSTYCTDFFLDTAEKSCKKQLVDNNSSYTPSSLVKTFRTREYKEILIYDN